MNLHEYQAKAILQTYGVSVPRHSPCFSFEQAERIAKQLVDETKNETIVVKAQIHAGGRGKGSFKHDPKLRGVVVVKGYSEAKRIAREMLGNTLITHQTGPEGKIVNRVLIEQGVDIAREIYVACLIDRKSQLINVIACAEGGMDIETVAEESPEKILSEKVYRAMGLMPYQARRLAIGLGLRGDEVNHAADFFMALVRAFEESDASLAEINPLVVTKSGQVMALDAKFNLDDNAEYRHPTWNDLQDVTEENPAELEARRHGLSYVKLDGTIGCMVNGAGLAMATMDIIQEFGGEPANFLDVGGNAKTDRVSAAFKIILSDPHVRGIFINIFGGIVHCDIVAQGVLNAVREVGLNVPLVVRLEGTNVEEGRRLLRESSLNVVSADDMADGARKIVERTR